MHAVSDPPHREQTARRNRLDRSHQFDELPVQALNCGPGDWYFPTQVEYWASLWPEATQSIVKLAQGTPTGSGRGVRIGCRPEVMEKVLNEVWRHRRETFNEGIGWD